MSGENVAQWVGAALASGLVSGVVAYMTAVSTLNTKTAVLEERESNHYKELDRKVEDSSAFLGGRIKEVLDELSELRKEVREL